ncbi:hypothetical protein CsSME_00024727 [Camellia sinensis var. sinensis]
MPHPLRLPLRLSFPLLPLLHRHRRPPILQIRRIQDQLFGIIINASPTHSRIHVFEFLNPGSTSLEVKPGLSWFAGDPEGAGRSVVELIEFAKKRVPKSEWRNTKVQLMGSSELERVKLVAMEAIFESCRRVLWSSGFLFKNEWLAIMEG